MDAATIQARIYSGYAKAAQYIGAPFNVFRPTGPTSPISGSPLLTLSAAFTPHSQSNFGFGKPADYKNPMFHAMLDGSRLQVGDYLVGPVTYFLLSLDPMQPPLACLCNRIVKVAERAETTGEGVKNYGGDVAQTDPIIANGWPCSCLKGARAVREDALPGDDGVGSFEIILPLSIPLSFVPAMNMSDELNNQYTVQVAEKSTYAWRIMTKSEVV